MSEKASAKPAKAGAGISRKLSELSNVAVVALAVRPCRGALNLCSAENRAGFATCGGGRH